MIGSNFNLFGSDGICEGLHKPRISSTAVIGAAPRGIWDCSADRTCLQIISSIDEHLTLNSTLATGSFSVGLIPDGSWRTSLSMAINMAISMEKTWDKDGYSIDQTWGLSWTWEHHAISRLTHHFPNERPVVMHTRPCLREVGSRKVTWKHWCYDILLGIWLISPLENGFFGGEGYVFINPNHVGW